MFSAFGVFLTAEDAEKAQGTQSTLFLSDLSVFSALFAVTYPLLLR
jgi:hypothetical protein